MGSVEKVSRLWLLAILALAALVSGISLAMAQAAPSRFPIRESGYWTCDSGREGCVYWLDNERIIFNGSKPSDYETMVDGGREWRKYRHAIYIWNLKTGEVAKHADADRASVCHAGGYVRYSRTIGEDVAVLAGPLGKEVEVERRKKTEQVDAQGWNTNLSCGRYKPDAPSSPQGVKVALMEGHGYLYFGLRSAAERREPVVYFPNASKAGINLPVARWQLNPAKVVRSDFDDSYFLLGPHRKSESAGVDLCPRASIEQQTYRLTVDGRVTAIPIPADQRLRCYASPIASSRTGVVVGVGAGNATNLDASILYIVREKRIDEVVRGVTTDRVVSPDGCSLAVGISSSRDPNKPTAAMDRGHLKVIDLCAKGGR